MSDTKKRLEEFSKFEIYKTIFTSTFSLSAFTVGGGYVIVPLLQQKFADELGWISEEEMLDFVAIGQSSPGPIAVNTSILVGYKVAGVVGALIATLGTVLPPLIIISIISIFYDLLKDNQVFALTLKSMQAGVAAVIVDVVIGMGENVVKRRSLLSLIIMIGAFVLVYFLKVNVIFIILGCIGIALIRTFILAQKGGK